MKKGFTLIETLVVVVVFALIGIIASETLILTLKGTAKSESISKIRQNLDFAISSMERQIRGAQSITSCGGTSLIFIDQFNHSVAFNCNNVNTSNQASSIASNSAELTTSSISISACSFTCTAGSGSTPATVLISITASDLSGQNSSITDTTQVTLRSY